MGNSCCSSKSRARHKVKRTSSLPTNLPPQQVVVTASTPALPEPEQPQWNREEIERIVDACEVELKQLIATTEASPLPLHAQKPGIYIYGIDTARGFLMKSVWECPHPPETVLAFTQDNSFRLTWDPNLAECRHVGDVDAHISLTYERYNKILVVSARDILSAGKTCPIDIGLLDISVSVEIPEIPAEKGVVRARLFVGGYHILPTAQGSLVTLYNEMDFGGAIPRKLLVMMSARTLTGWVEAFNMGIAKFAVKDR